MNLEGLTKPKLWVVYIVKLFQFFSIDFSTIYLPPKWGTLVSTCIVVRGKCKSLRQYVRCFLSLNSSIVNAFLKLSRHKKVCSFSIELTCCLFRVNKIFQMPFCQGFKAGATHIFPKATSDVTKSVHNFLSFLGKKIWKKLTMLNQWYDPFCFYLLAIETLISIQVSFVFKS